MLELENKKVVVVGAGLSGLASCRFLLEKGAIVTLADGKSREELGGELDELAKRGVYLLLDNRLPDRADWQLAVKSPGVPPTTPLMKMIAAAGVPVIGELELAYLFAKGDFVAITGTNGKTTTTALLGKIFDDFGLPAVVGGNIGKPLIELVAKHRGIFVAEVSSFQLEDAVTFKPKVGVFLNLTPDHLDRHGDMANYLAVKERIFLNQDENDFAVLNYDDPLFWQTAKKIRSRAVWFSRREMLAEGVYVKDGAIIIADQGENINVLPTKDIYIKGAHNLENCLAATAAAYVMGVAPRSIARSLRSFLGVEHRLERVAEIDGIVYVNDSKGTNPDSTIKALEAYDRPVVLIVGGRNKGSDFAPLMQMVKRKARFLIILGECQKELEEAAQAAGFFDYLLAESFEDGVKKAIGLARPGDVVMLSPACASWDMFRDYQERGKLFKSLVLAHGEEVSL